MFKTSVLWKPIFFILRDRQTDVHDKSNDIFPQLYKSAWHRTFRTDLAV